MSNIQKVRTYHPLTLNLLEAAEAVILIVQSWFLVFWNPQNLRFPLITQTFMYY